MNEDMDNFDNIEIKEEPAWISDFFGSSTISAAKWIEITP